MGVRGQGLGSGLGLGFPPSLGATVRQRGEGERRRWWLSWLRAAASSPGQRPCPWRGLRAARMRRAGMPETVKRLLGNETVTTCGPWLCHRSMAERHRMQQLLSSHHQDKNHHQSTYHHQFKYHHRGKCLWYLRTSLWTRLSRQLRYHRPLLRRRRQRRLQRSRAGSGTDASAKTALREQLHAGPARPSAWCGPPLATSWRTWELRQRAPGHFPKPALCCRGRRPTRDPSRSWGPPQAGEDRRRA